MKMRMLVVVTLGVVGIPLAHAAEVGAQTPSDPVAQALEKQVRQFIEQDQNYQAAVTAYAQAARTHPTDAYYRDQFALMRSVAKLQAALAGEPVAEKWRVSAEAVRAYLYSRGFYQAALAVDQAAYERFKDLPSAARKLESLLLAGQDSQAQSFVQSLGQIAADAAPARWPTLCAVALARSGKTAEALAAVADVKVNPQENLTSLFDLARVFKAAGKTDDAMYALRLFLEHTVPTEMATSQSMITLCADFKDLQGQEQFKTVLATQSKVAQSGCTGGSNCSTCALKGKCATSK